MKIPTMNLDIYYFFEIDLIEHFLNSCPDISVTQGVLTVVWRCERCTHLDWALKTLLVDKSQ
jgi:hypothetical protein